MWLAVMATGKGACEVSIRARLEAAGRETSLGTGCTALENLERKWSTTSRKAEA